MKSRSRIDKSALAIGTPHRVRSEPYRRYVSTRPCMRCGVVGKSQAAHETYGNYARGLKASDALCFPACVHCHNKRDQDIGPAAFWRGIFGERRDLLMRAVKAMLREDYAEWERKQ